MSNDALVIRCSSTTTYPGCPRRWAAHNLSREIRNAGYALRDTQNGIGAAVGISVHAAARAMNDENAATGKLPSASTATDIAVSTVKEEIARGVEYDQTTTRTANEAEQQVARMALSYRWDIAPTINAIAIEARFEAQIPWSTQNIILSGQPDIVAREPGKIDDLKTGARMGWHLCQIGAYSLVVRANQIAEIEEGQITWIPRVSVKKPQPAPTTHRQSIAKAETVATNILRAIDDAVRVWREGDEARGVLPGDPAAFMANPTSQLCNPKYCRAHSAGANGWCTEWSAE